MRKDVERTFGTLKKRFRILRLPFLYEREERVTNVFKMCCVPHNRLLEEDGIADLGQAETDWIDRQIRDPALVRPVSRAGTFTVTPDTDLLFLATTVNWEEMPTRAEKAAFHAMRNALVEHFVASTQTHGVQRLRTVASIRANSRGNSDADERGL